MTSTGEVNDCKTRTPVPGIKIEHSYKLIVPMRIQFSQMGVYKG